MRKLLTPVLALAAFFAMSVPAFAHDNAITAKSVCTSQKNATWQATFTGSNDYRLGETMTFTGAVTGSVQVGAFGSASKSVIVTGQSATAGVYGVWSDGYHNGPPANHTATAYRPENCIPVNHTPVIRGSAVCSKHGKYVVRYTLVNGDGGVTLTVFPIVHRVPGTSTSDSASATFVYGNGPDQTARATVQLSGHCKPPVKLPPPVVKAPHARLVGPCGDPYYGAVFNNTHSNRAVTFVWSYVNFYTGHRTSVRVKVGAGQKHLVPFRHVLGNTRQSIRTASGEVLVRGIAAPPGNYGACRF